MTMTKQVTRVMRNIGSLLVLLSMVLMLSGCLGGGPNVPGSKTVAVSGTVMAPRALGGSEPVAGASVAALDFADGKQVGTVATTDVNGAFSISKIPKGSDVVIVATTGAAAAKASRGPSLRITSLLADVANTTGAEVNGMTSLAAEAWGVLFLMGRDVAKIDFRTTLDAARRILERLGESALELVPGGTVIGPSFGSGIVLGWAGRSELMATVPDEEDSLVWPAKEMVQDLRDAGLSIRGAVEQELMEPANLLVTEVAPHLAAIAEHVGNLHTYLLYDEPGFFHEDEYGGLWYDGPADPDDPKWVVERYDGSVETWTKDLTGTRRSPWSETVTFSVEWHTGFDFRGSLSLEGDSDLTHGLPIRGMLDAVLCDPEDEFLSVETVLAGDYEGDFGDDPMYANVSVEGDFESEYIDAHGELAIEGDLENGGTASFSGSVTAAGLVVSGLIELDAVINNTVDEEPIPVPSRVTIEGSLGKVGASVPLFQGTVEVEFDNADTYDFSEDWSETNWPVGEVVFNGTCNPPGKAAVSALIAIDTEEYMVFDSTVRYEHGTRWIAGTISVELEPDEDDGRIELNLYNQAGLVMEMTIEASQSEYEGTIENSSGTKIAVIEADSEGLVRIVYIDDSWESLF